MGGFRQAHGAAPIRGRRTFNSSLEYIANTTPDRLFSWVPISEENLDDGFRQLSFGEFYNSVCAAAHWLDQSLGKIGDDFASRQTIAYIGPNDIRYFSLIMAADRTNRSVSTSEGRPYSTLLLCLPTNTTEAQVRLLKGANSAAVLSPQSDTYVWDEVLPQLPKVRRIVVPELDFFYAANGPIYPYDRDMVEFWDAAPFLTQTSGTTGFPKTLPITNASMSASDMISGDIDGSDVPLMEQHAPVSGFVRTTIANFNPSAWASGVFIGLLGPLFFGSIAVIVPASRPSPPTVEYFQRVRQLVPSINAAFLTPEGIRQLYSTSGGLDFLASFHTVYFVGAPLDNDIGDALAKVTRVQNFMGSTDAGLYDYFANADRKDWAWMHLDLSGPWSLEHCSENLYELVLQREPERLRGAFHLHPELDVYRTSDLFVQHPDPGKKHLWRPAGRADDFVRLKSMTTFNAINIERNIDRSVDIERSVVEGNQRNAPFVILQPAAHVKYANDADVLEAMWPGIESANEHLLPEIQLKKHLAIIAKPDRPLTTTLKGTTQRRKAIGNYAEEIEALYKDA
ncbi:hypothetical protein ANO11243_082280 [Dothideomycetidae sp. 11243]|nr:hypothetical protein ANO11243_082280 [fungal sp. No.11243]